MAAAFNTDRYQRTLWSAKIVIGKSMSVLNSARFAGNRFGCRGGRYQSVVQRQNITYNFTASVRSRSRFGTEDIDGNSETERMPTWEPLDVTPMHPEYPCAHRRKHSGSDGHRSSMIGGSDIPEVAITMPSAAGLTHHYTPTLNAFTDEVANARIYAGFHYRTSTVDYGRNMGREIGAYTAVKTILQNAF